MQSLQRAESCSLPLHTVTHHWQSVDCKSTIQVSMRSEMVI